MNKYIEALFNSPGPTTPREGIVLYIKGFCMGCADIIPGVSGGTIALITGIYENLLHAIRSFDAKAIKHLLTLNILKLLEKVHVKFLAILLFGIASAIICFSRIIHHVLESYPIQTWGFFFGLIVASIYILGGQIKHWVGNGGFFFSLGGILAYLIMGAMPVATPNSLWFIFLSGMLAICAMILPGISGAFILLILGKYSFIIGTLKNPFQLHNMMIISTFITGCATGLPLFTKFLNYMLNKYHNITLAVLTGFMFGSLRKIWPWKEIVEIMEINGKEVVLSYNNILPPNIDCSFYATCIIAIIGFVLISILNYKTDQLFKRH